MDLEDLDNLDGPGSVDKHNSHLGAGGRLELRTAESWKMSQKLMGKERKGIGVIRDGVASMSLE